STFTSNLVNEGRVGYSGAPVQFFPEYTPALWSGSVANQNGFNLAFPSIGSQLTSPGGGTSTNAVVAPSPQSRNATALLIEDNLTWLKGAHSFTMGASSTQYSLEMTNQTLVPGAIIGIANTDPAAAMFSATNFPGASATQLTAVGNLYALLTGRISQFTSEA